MSIPANLIDPTLTGDYPVILSDALMGTTAKEIFTGLRCTCFSRLDLTVDSSLIRCFCPQTTTSPQRLRRHKPA